MVTNLRLPGQYDERLFSSVGIQGPYYNWNRWYLPAVGRYVEPDPIAASAGFNGPYGPNWYGYAEGNPLRRTDRTGMIAVADDILVAALVATTATALYAWWQNNFARDTRASDPWRYPDTASPSWLKPLRPQPDNVPPVFLDPIPNPLPTPSPDGVGDDECGKRYAQDLAMCRAIGRNRCGDQASRCYATAMARLNACQLGIRPLPPLDTVNW
jgi:RHS repeat-associated protein